MEVQLKVMAGSSAGQLIKIAGPKFFIGRSDDCHLRPRSDLISRHHCVILIEGDYLGVRDFGSKNGTQVNGQRVAGEVPLNASDRLTVGPLEFEVVVQNDPLKAPKKPKVQSVKEAASRTAESSIGSSAENDLDISDWLSDGDNGETREIPRSQETVEAAPGALDPPTSSHAKATSDTIADVPGKPEVPKKAAPGKLPPIGKASGSSEDAAAEMLRKLRKR